MGGRVHRFTIGKHGSPWTPSRARDEAGRLLALIKTGSDPAALRSADKMEKSVTELCDLYLAEGCETKKPSTVATDKGRIERHIMPLLGKKRVKDITQNDIRRFMKDVADGKTKADEKTGKYGRAIVKGGRGTAARTVGLLGGIFSFAVSEGIRPDNPVRGVMRYPDGKSERHLSREEMATLGEALAAAEDEGENATAIAAVRMLILTGCRKSEILTLQWENVDIDHACLRLPESKTGEKIVPLGAPVLEVLASLPRIEGNPYVLPGEKEKWHLVGLPRVWQRIKKRANLQDLRLHDLRHSFASVGASAGMGLPIIGKLLRHRYPKTTARYAHIGDDPARSAADRISESISAALNGESGGEVVELPNRKT